jgi:hypothetical protein
VTVPDDAAGDDPSSDEQPSARAQRAAVRQRYGAIAAAEGPSTDRAASTDAGERCCTEPASADADCCSTDAPAARSRAVGYSTEDIAAAPDGANLGLGCGNPGAIADLEPGETVLDHYRDASVSLGAEDDRSGPARDSDPAVSEVTGDIDEASPSGADDGPLTTPAAAATAIPGEENSTADSADAPVVPSPERGTADTGRTTDSQSGDCGGDDSDETAIGDRHGDTATSDSQGDTATSDTHSDTTTGDSQNDTPASDTDDDTETKGLDALLE